MPVETHNGAIETFYRGCRFRSRIEARWAVLFDELSVEWEYEREGYVLEDGTCYLPDFWLPQQQEFIEIKGEPITKGDNAWEKARLLADLTFHPVTVFAGGISNNPVALTGVSFEWIGSPVRVWWFQCPVCSAWGLSSQLRYLMCGCLDIDAAQQPALVAACKRARSARFEFGEQG